MKFDVRNRWRNTQILVIDEISLLSAELFDTLSEIGKHVRNNFTLPFGGIRVVVCGDFFQLPPVNLSATNHFCFHSAAWNELFPSMEGTPEMNNNINSNNNRNNDNQLGKVIILDRVYRQKENLFLDVLNEIRIGEISEKTARFLQQKSFQDSRRIEQIYGSNGSVNSTAQEGGIIIERPTKLFGRNRNVDDYNTKELAKLISEEPPETFSSQDFSANSSYKTQLNNGSRLPESITLKIGAEVMLLWNLESTVGLVNGARGKVVSFEKSRGRSEIFKTLPVVEFRLRFQDEEVTETRVICEQETEIRQGSRLVLFFFFFSF